MSLRHLPTRRMVYWYNCSMIKTMPPPTRRERVLMSDSVNPISGPDVRTTYLMEAVLSSPRICCHLSPFLKLEIGAAPVVPLCRRYSTRQCMASTRHPWGWTVILCLIDSPFNPFFWVMNRILTKSACARMSLVSVTAL